MAPFIMSFMLDARGLLAGRGDLLRDLGGRVDELGVAHARKLGIKQTFMTSLTRGSLLMTSATELIRRMVSLAKRWRSRQPCR